MGEDGEKLKKVSDLLKNASEMLLSVRNSSASNASDSSLGSTTTTGTATGSIAETLIQARSMMRRSSSAGLYRRLNRNERLRAATTATKNKKSKSKPLEKKPFEFALLRPICEESDEEDGVETLTKDKIIESGMIVLDEDNDESSVHAKIASSLKAKYSLLGPNDFDFVKVTQKKISVLRLGENTEYNYSVVKKLAGQGLLYVRLKQAFDFVLYDQVELMQDDSSHFPDNQSVRNSNQQTLSSIRTTSTTTGQTDVSPPSPTPTLVAEGLRSRTITPTFTQDSSHLPDNQNVSSYNQQTQSFTRATCTTTGQTDGIHPSHTPTLETEELRSRTITPTVTPLWQPEELSSSTMHQTASEQDNGIEFYDKIISEFPETVIVEPTEMLRYLQGKIVRGRPLEITDDATVVVGETNFIAVDRSNILETTFEELKAVKDPRVTFEVDFYGEMAQDSGGPRKEWIRLCNQKIQTKYFEQGLKDHLAEEYFLVGHMAAIALLQNGQTPKYFSENLLNDIFVSEEKEISPCVLKLRQGLDSVGIHLFARKFPQFLYLLRPSNNARLTVPMLIHLLKPKFSEEGANSLIYEKAVYRKFIKYMREAASGRRVTTLENILEFVTGASEEPILGFVLQPCIEFHMAVVTEVAQAVVPKANEGNTDDDCTEEEVNTKLFYMQV